MDLKALNELEARAKSAEASSYLHAAAMQSLFSADRSQGALTKLLNARDPNGPFYTYQGVSESQQIAIDAVHEVINEMKPEILAIAIARIKAKELSLKALSERRRKLIEFSILQVEGANEQE